MKRILIAACLTLALPACEGWQPPSSPGEVAGHTVADDIAMLDAEIVYKLSRTAMEAMVDGGLLKGENAAKAAALDNQIYAAYQAARQAYTTFNSPSLVIALANMRALANQIIALRGIQS